MSEFERATIRVLGVLLIGILFILYLQLLYITPLRGFSLKIDLPILYREFNPQPTTFTP